MKITDYAILAGLSVLAHIGTMLRHYPMGYDPYFFMTDGLAQMMGYSSYWIDALFFAPALTSIVFTFTFLVMVFKLAEALSSPSPLLSAALLVSAPQFVYRSALIEDDLLGLSGALFFLLLYVGWLAQPKLNTTLKAAGMAILSLMTWKGTMLYVGAAGLDWLRSKMPWVVWLTPLPAVWMIIGDNFTGEGAYGLFYMIGGLGLIILFMWPLIRNTSTNRPLTTFSWVFFVLALVQARFIWLFAPFASILAVEHWYGWFQTPKGQAVLGFGLVMGLVFANVGVMVEEPTLQTMTDIKTVALITGNYTIANEWQYGHWLNWAGANPQFTNLYPQKEYVIPEGSSYALVSHDNEMEIPYDTLYNFTSFALLKLPAPA